MSIIIDELELRKKLDDKEIVILDVRTKYDDFETGEAAYKHSHVPGALYVDVNTYFKGTNTFLPDIDMLAKKLGDLGIRDDTSIVLYDQGNHRAATKAWVVFNYIGHEPVYILNGGFKAWAEAGNEVTTETPAFSPTIYHVKRNEDIVVSIDQVKASLETENAMLIDSRSYDRYSGKVEPKYKKAGHIPGAKNYHSKRVMSEKGLWKTTEELRCHFKDLQQDEEIMVSCGSGNSACINFVALIEAGFKEVKIYPGGFSEWIKDDHNEVEKTD
ncbi:sulfurtransferase [Pseudogracilibacillus sp. SE30717A]|uniref:sulfurtransferase n=1 Tax=Pseudogracilibacillus sp. SE30717A TaxID=3098293 RepID=UPI00300DF874